MSIFVKNLGELVSVTDKYKNAQNESRFQSFVTHIRYQRIPSGNLESVFWFKLNPSTNLTYWLRAHYNPVQGEGLEVFKATSLKPLVFLWGFFCCLSTSGTGDSPGCCSIGLHTSYIVGAVTLMLCNPVHRQQDNSHVKSTRKISVAFSPHMPCCSVILGLKSLCAFCFTSSSDANALQNGNFCLYWTTSHTQVLRALCLAPLLFQGAEGGTIIVFSQAWFLLAGLLETLTNSGAWQVLGKKLPSYLQILPIFR